MVGNPRDWAPAPGSSPWEQEAEAYARARDEQRQEAREVRPRRRRMRWILTPLGVVGCLVAIGLAAGGPADDSTKGAGPSSRAATPIAGSSDHPPQDDLNADTTCSLDTVGSVVAQGTVTNHTVGTSGYRLHVAFTDDAGVRFAEGAAFREYVRAGETVEWEANGFTPPAGTTWTCEVVSIERYSSG